MVAGVGAESEWSTGGELNQVTFIFNAFDEIARLAPDRVPG